MTQDTGRSERAVEKDRLIESIYRIALDPQSYDAFMELWAGYVSARLADTDPDSAGEDMVAADTHELSGHFQIATSLLDKTMPPPTPLDAPRTDRLHGAAGENGAPRFLLDCNGRIVWHNAAAQRLLQLDRSSTIDRLQADDESRARLAQLCEGLKQTGHKRRSLPVVVGLRLPERGDTLHFQAQAMPNGDIDEVVLVAPMGAGWPAGMEILLRDDFGLTPSEAEICEQVADGLPAAGIASLRGSALATVRTQLKRIMAKMRVASQPELVRLLHLLMRLAETHREEPSRTAPAGTELRHVRLPERRMPVVRFGPETGDPVLFLHGMLDGVEISRDCAALLNTLNLQLICPVRPCFGGAEEDRGPTRTAPQRLAADLQILIGHLRLSRVVLMGHMAGSVYAFAAAAAVPAGQLAGVVNVAGGVPILSPAQLSSMAPRQRLVAYTARYSPAFLPFILRAGIRQMRAGGERRFLLSLYENAPQDLAVAMEDEIQRILLGGYRFSVAQGHRAFEIDSAQVVHDWSALVRASRAPVRLIHGRHDPVVSIASVHDFAAGDPGRITVQEVPDCGQLVFYKRPAIALRAARSLFGHAPPS